MNTKLRITLFFSVVLSLSVLAIASADMLCTNKTSGALSIKRKCAKNENAITNQKALVGPKGDTGPKGDAGAAGSAGPTGPAGAGGTITGKYVSFAANCASQGGDVQGSVGVIGTNFESSLNLDGSFTLYNVSPGTYDLYLRTFSFVNPGSGVNVGGGSTAGSLPTLLSNITVTGGQTTNVGTIRGSSSCCGNFQVDNGEVCDSPDMNGATCISLGRLGGNLQCQSGCGGYNLDSCSQCGNDAKEEGETCDGVDLGGATCASQGFTSGTLACAGSCLAFNTTGCTP